MGENFITYVVIGVVLLIMILYKLVKPEERNLLLRLLDFRRVLENAFARRATDLLANYTYDLAQDINTFYHNCPILRDDVAENIKQMRLHIVDMAQKTLNTAIDLMGLRVPDSM